MVLQQCTRVKPFFMYPINAAGDLVTEDEPDWLRLWEGPLTEEERMIYKKFVPEGVEYFDRARKIFNVELRIPLTKFLDKEGAKISFRREWDMVVAEHVRRVIASARPRLEEEMVNDDTEDSAGNDSYVSLPRPYLDSSGDFTFTSEEDEEESWPRVHPVAPVYRIYHADGTIIPVSNLPSTSPTYVATGSQHRQSAPHTPHNSAPHTPHNSAPHQPHNSAPHQQHNSAPHQRPTQANFPLILFYYHGRTTAFHNTLPHVNNPSHVSVLDHLYGDGSSTTGRIFEEVDHFSFIMGRFVPYLHHLIRNIITEDDVERVFTLMPTFPNMNALVALHESTMLNNTRLDRQALADLHDINSLEERTIPSRQNPALAGTTAGVNFLNEAFGEASEPRNFGLVGSSEWDSIANGSGNSSNELDELEDLSFEVAAHNLMRQPRSLSSNPMDYSLRDTVRCRTELDIAIKQQTLAAAKNLASTKSKADMVRKLEETASVELAKEFLKTPDSAFVLHRVYKNPGQPFGIRSVPRHKVLPDSFVSGSFITLKTLGESVDGGDLDNFFVEYWSAALELTEAHFLAHDETLKALQDVSLNDEADSKIIYSHLNCLRECLPEFARQLKRHKKMLKEVSCVLTIREYHIGKQLLKALKKISLYQPPEAIRTNYVRPNSEDSFTSDSLEEFSE